MPAPHVASLVEDAWNRALGTVLTARGWRHRVVPHVGYGSPEFLRVLARVVHAPRGEAPVPPRGGTRGWRSFITAEAPGVPVRVTVEGETHHGRTDRSGTVDLRLPNPGLAPGWHEVEVRAGSSAPVPARVLVIGEGTTLGIVSDIDDTVIRTLLPRPLVAAYNTFVLTEEARRPVPGMASLYAGVLAAFPGTPTVYVSTGAWNIAGRLGRFLEAHGYPSGPLLLTDWGPTNTGWFRSGREHKEQCLRSLAEDFPRVSWLLVGDDGQHDPVIYRGFAREHPDRVRAIAIRELGGAEQVTHLRVADAEAEAGHAGPPVPGVPEVRGEDGAELAAGLEPVLGPLPGAR